MRLFTAMQVLAQEAVVHIKDLIGQRCRRLEEKGHQGGMAAEWIKPLEKLRRVATAFPGELQEAILMDLPCPLVIKAKCSDEVEALNELENRRRRGLARWLAQPGQAGLTPVWWHG